MLSANRRIALRVCLIYLILSLVWIYTSDHILGALVRDPDHLTSIQTIVRRALSGETFTGIATVARSTFETHFSPLKNERGELDGVIAVSV